MAYLKYEDAEKLFLQEIQPIGVKKVIIQAEGRYDYYQITLNNGHTRYWKANQQQTKHFEEELDKLQEVPQ